MTKSLVLVVLLLVPCAALAQAPDPRERVGRAITLYDEAMRAGGEDARRALLAAALAELEQAYRESQAPLVVFNLGRVEAELGRPVAALEHLELFMSETQTSDSPARRVEAEALIGVLRSRVAELQITSSIDGATVFVDGEPRGRTPLDGTLRVPAGEVRIEIRAAGFLSMERTIRVAGEATESIVASLERQAGVLGSVRIHSLLEAVSITIDGEPHGQTPLEASIPLPEGPHSLVAVREGYERLERSFDVRIGEEREIEVALRARPGHAQSALALAIPEVPTFLRVDGEAVAPETRLVLPPGPHSIEIHVRDRQVFILRLELARDGEATVTPPLAWTEEARRARVGAAETQRVVGAVIAGAGGLLAAGGIVMASIGGVARFGELPQKQDRLRFCQSGPMACILPELNQLENEVPAIDQWSTGLFATGIALGAMGVVGAIVGIVLYDDAESDGEIDAGARTTLRASGTDLTMETTW